MIMEISCRLPLHDAEREDGEDHAEPGEGPERTTPVSRLGERSAEGRSEHDRHAPRRGHEAQSSAAQTFGIYLGDLRVSLGCDGAATDALDQPPPDEELHLRRERSTGEAGHEDKAAAYICRTMTERLAHRLDA